VIAFLNPARFDYQFPVASYLEAAPAMLVSELAAILAASLAEAQEPPAHVASLVRAAKIEERHRAAAAALKSGARRAVWLGALALRHAAFADLRALAAALAGITGGTFGVLAEGGNAAGAYLAGAVPHRIAGGRASATPGFRPGKCCRRRFLPTCSLVSSPGRMRSTPSACARSPLPSA
jgi:NADH-quinone oxidoreductase subunit G